MDKKIKVSIVIPIYNAELYLGKCLDSVLSQSLEEIEIICINDGSTDRSLQILNEYADNGNIVIIDQENQGAGMARNKGIMSAKGKYIAFIDPDDYYAADNVLETLYTFAEQESIMICCGNIRDINGNYVGKVFYENKRMTFTGLQNCGFHVGTIFNLDFLKQNQIYYPNYRRFQDPPFMTKAMIKAKEFFSVSTDIYIYRVGHKFLDITEEILINVINGVHDIFEMIYDDGNILLEFASYVYDGNREFMLQHSCGRLESAALQKALGELNVAVSKVLGEKNTLGTEEMEIYQNQCIEIYRAIRDKKPIIIYGAGIAGRKVINDIHNLGGNIIGIAVTDIKGNPAFIEGVPVKPIAKYGGYEDEAVVIIATDIRYQKEIKDILAKYQFKKINVGSKGKLEYAKKRLEG